MMKNAIPPTASQSAPRPAPQTAVSVINAPAAPRISRLRSPRQYARDIVLTVLGWLAFGYLLVDGVLAVLQATPAGPLARTAAATAPAEATAATPLSSLTQLPPQLLPTLLSVLGVAALTLIGAALLIAWAKYNQFRFARPQHPERRLAPAALSRLKLAESFGLSAVQLVAVQTARAMVIRHDAAGRVVHIDIIDVSHPVTEAESTAPLAPTVTIRSHSTRAAQATAVKLAA